MHAEFIKPTDPRWRSFLDRSPHDFYHLPKYVSFAAKHEGGEPVAFLAQHKDSELFVPLILRPLPEHLFACERLQDAVSPYGYAAPLYCGSQGTEQENDIWQLFKDYCAAQSVVSVFLRYHPLLPVSCHPSKADRLVKEGETIFVDLRQDQDELWKQTRENHRKGIRKLKNQGFCSIINDWRYYDRFIEIYLETMKRVGASSYYMFTRQYFEDLKAMNNGNVHLCSILSPCEELAAGGLFYSLNGFVQFHLSGTSSDYLKLAPTKLMFDFVRQWSKQSGFRYLHLGGGVGSGNDSLLNFKAGFSHDRAEYYTARMVCDRSLYEQLSNKTKREDSFTGAREEFFPAYRLQQETTVAEPCRQ